MSNNLGDFSYFKTAVGGVLAIPNKWSPSNFVYIDKNWMLDRDEDYVINDWGDDPINGQKSPYWICKKLHPKEDLESCIARGWDTWVAQVANGGLRRFDCDDGKGNRLTYNACWMSSIGGKLLDFEEKYFAGYYPNIDGTTSTCFGTPYQIETEKREEKKPGNFEANPNVKFSINLALDK